MQKENTILIGIYSPVNFSSATMRDNHKKYAFEQPYSYL